MNSWIDMINKELEREGLENELFKKLKTTRQRVEYLLQRYPKARESDFYLIILYLRKFTELGQYIRHIPFSLIRKYEGIFETIRRIRAKLQSEGKYLPENPDVLKRRKKLGKVMRKVIKEV